MKTDSICSCGWPCECTDGICRRCANHDLPVQCLDEEDYEYEMPYVDYDEE